MADHSSSIIKGSIPLFGGTGRRRLFCDAYRQQRQKTYFRAYAPSEDSDQTAHSRSLIRIFTGRILDTHGYKVSSC